MIQQIFDDFGLDGVQSFPNKTKATNNFIGSQSGSYSSQSVETKRIVVTAGDYEAWIGMNFYLMGKVYGLGDAEIKVLVGITELSNSDREFMNSKKVHEYVSQRIGICPNCVRNQVYFLRKKGFVKRKRGGVWSINERVWWMLKNSQPSRKLIISIEYEPELNIAANS